VMHKLLAVVGLCRHPEGTLRRRHADGTYGFLCCLCWKEWKL
jgi:hypothetical protein